MATTSPMCSPTELGRRLRTLRAERKWTQPQVVERAGMASTSALVRIEKGQQLPSLPQIVRLAAIFEVALCWLIRPSDEPGVVLADRHRLTELEHTDDSDDPLWDQPWSLIVTRDTQVMTIAKHDRAQLRLQERRTQLLRRSTRRPADGATGA